MLELTDLLTRTVALGFILLGAYAAVVWLRDRSRGRGWLALALVLLGVLALITQLSSSVAIDPVIVNLVSLFAFLGSGYALLELRHSIARYPLGLHRMALFALCGAAAASFLDTFLPRPSHSDTLHTTAALLVIVAWIGCVVEPAVHFWVVSRDRPRIQQGRLRALAAGYIGIIAVLVLSVGFGFTDRILAGTPEQPVALGAEVVALAVIPLLYFSFAPPQWLRRAWRADEEEAFLRAIGQLLVFTSDNRALADEAVDWALRLVGADGGLVLGSDGTVLASRGLDQAEEGDLVTRARAALAENPAGGMAGANLAVPLRTAVGTGILALVGGPFTPVFGSDELRRLQNFATSLAIALDRVRLVDELREQTERMESLLAAVSELGEGLLITERGELVYANKAYLDLTGYSADELVSRNLIELAPKELQADLAERLASRLGGSSEPVYYESQLVRKNGTVVDIDTVIHRLANESPGRLIAIVRDITARKKAELQLALAARLDALTQVPNRRAWDDELPQALNRARRDKTPLCVAILDLDAFKEFNDDWGHQRGDRLLFEVAQAWRRALREVDFLARYGGDEFAILMPNCTLQQAEGVLQRLVAVTPERQEASMGLAEWSGDEPAEELVARADAALFRSKRFSRGGLTMASAQAADDSFTGWSRRIAEILAKRGLVSAYQPIIDLRDGHAIGYEALARPAGAGADANVDDLFHAAQRLGYTRDLDWLSRRAALEGSHALPEGALLFINVSAWALLDPVHNVDQMLLLLQASGRKPYEVVLEISEREIISDLARLRIVLAEFRDEGFRFALDDVGEGHSTLEVLAAAGAEYIKVARSLTQRLDIAGPGSAVRAIVTFADSTGAKLIAEGIADEDTARSVRTLGINLGQGFALGRPTFLGGRPLPAERAS